MFLPLPTFIHPHYPESEMWGYLCLWNRHGELIKDPCVLHCLVVVGKQASATVPIYRLPSMNTTVIIRVLSHSKYQKLFSYLECNYSARQYFSTVCAQRHSEMSHGADHKFYRGK